MNTKEIKLQLTENECDAFRALARRFGRSDALEHSESKEEAAHMMHAMYELEQKLNQGGNANAK